MLVGANGGVRLSGLRSAASLLLRGRRQRHLHQLPPPDHDNTNLMWLSPELLEQVHCSYLTLVLLHCLYYSFLIY